MTTIKKISWMLLWAVLMLLAGNQKGWAQKAAVTPRVVTQVDDTRVVQIRGNVHPLARAEFDQGALQDSQPMQRMLLLLERSAEQERALRQLLDEQQDRSSANFHAWLRPEQFGKQFGPSDADLQAVTDWLTRQGFQIGKISAGRTVIEFSGNVAQVRHAFHTEIHRYSVNGNEYFANVSDPAFPEALRPVVAGVVALHNFPVQSHARRVGAFQRDRATGELRPLFTYTDKTGTFYGVGPTDFAKIYNIPPGADGSGQSIAIVGQSNINIQDVQDFRSMFGLPANAPQIIVNGPDPGLEPPINGQPTDETESDLDVEWAGAVAPAAHIILVTSESTLSNPTQVSTGVDLSALYIIDNNVAPVMSESYGACEASLGTSGNAFYSSMWQQAAAQGITVTVSAGDNGSAACDPAPAPANQNAATQGLAVSGFASTPYNVAVGGTDFDQQKNPTQYWNSTNNATTQLSAMGYIPEVPWDDSACAANFPTACTSVDSAGSDLAAGSGGPSNCATSTSNGACAGYPKPVWQNGITPDNVRDLPDVSFFAGDGNNLSFYIVCQSDANPNNAPCDLSTSLTSGTENFLGIGGTSGSAPAFAGVMALVNQKQATAQNPTQRQGNANYVLYALAGNQNYSNCNSSSFTNPLSPPPSSCIFLDITKGSNSVACVGGTPNCSNTSTAANQFGILTTTTGGSTPAFNAGPKYDLATGLGSINVANLLANWGSISRTVPTTTLTNPSATTLTSGQAFSATVNVTPAAATGDVSLIALASDQITVVGSYGPFTLSGSPNNNVTVSANYLPANTAYVEGYYGGSAAYAPSASSPVAVAVNGANQPSVLKVSFVGFTSANAPMTPTTAAQNISYGSSYILRVDVQAASGTLATPCATSTTTHTIPCPTGTISLFDGGQPLKDFPIAGTVNASNTAKLNNQGFAEDQPVQFAAGSHSITATYSGDANYNSQSASNTLSVTVAKAATITAVTSSLGTITSGASVTLTATINTTSNGAGPTGNVQFMNGTTNLGTAVVCTPTNGSSSSTELASCIATLTTAISTLYPPPTNAPRMPVLPIALLTLSALLYFILLRGMPENRRRAFGYAGLVAFALLAAGIAGCGGGGGGSSTPPSTGKTVTINASYPGDGNYTGSSGSKMITVN
jgi:hypothetical protein